MKVLHVIPSISKFYGGPTSAIFSYVKNLRDIGIDARILTTDLFIDNKYKANDKMQIINGVPIFIMRCINNPIKKIKEFSFSVQIINWLKKNIKDYDLIHVYGLFRFTSTYAMKIAAKENIPYILYPTGGFNYENFKNNRLFKYTYLKFIDNGNIEKASFIHFNSEKEYLEAKNQKVKFTLKHFILPVGIKIPKWKEIEERINSEGYINFLFLARIHPIKKLDIILETFGIIKKKSNFKKWKLHIAGEGSIKYKNYLKNIAIKQGISSNIIWYGFIDNKKKTNLLRKCDWFILPSKTESFGISVVEALSFGLVPLITKDMGISNLLISNNLCFLIDSNPNSIAEKIINNMLRSPNLNERELCYLFAKSNFCEKKIAEDLKNKYFNIIKIT